MKHPTCSRRGERDMALPYFVLSLAIRAKADEHLVVSCHCPAILQQDISELYMQKYGKYSKAGAADRRDDRSSKVAAFMQCRRTRPTVMMTVLQAQTFGCVSPVRKTRVDFCGILVLPDVRWRQHAATFAQGVRIRSLGLGHIG